jgi:hypothetical protein
MKRRSEWDGSVLNHPGKISLLTKDEWTRFHCLHCAYHLGFALPQ